MNWLRLIPYAIAIIAISGAGYGLYRHGYNQHVEESKIADAEQAQRDIEKLRKLEGEKNANMVEIERLRANNHALWLRLPRNTSVACKDSTAGCGKLPEGTPSSAEQAINEFADQCGEQAYRCDSIVESCRVLNEALPK